MVAEMEAMHRWQTGLLTKADLVTIIAEYQLSTLW